MGIANNMTRKKPTVPKTPKHKRTPKLLEQNMTKRKNREPKPRSYDRISIINHRTIGKYFLFKEDDTNSSKKW